MPRYDTYINQLQNTKPDFYAQTNHGTLFVWFSPLTPIYSTVSRPIITAYFNGENPPIRFRSHDLNQQQGTYLFRKGRYRIYSTDLQPFTTDLWPGNLLHFKPPFPHFFIPYY